MSAAIKNELRELDAWIAELMETKPASVPLSAVRKFGDERFNYAREHSPGGWWICNTGTDAEDKRGDKTPCVWYPASDIASEPGEVESQAAAMQVLAKCARKTINLEIDFRNGDTFAVGCYRRSKIIEAVADTLPLAICRFARMIYDPK